MKRDKTVKKRGSERGAGDNTHTHTRLMCQTFTTAVLIRDCVCVCAHRGLWGQGEGVDNSSENVSMFFFSFFREAEAAALKPIRASC